MDPSAFPAVATVIGFTPESGSGPLVATLACPITTEDVEASVTGQESPKANIDDSCPIETDDPVTKALVDNIVGNLPTKKPVVKMRCDICNIEVNGKAVLEVHLAGAKHFKKMKLMESLAKSQEHSEVNKPAPLNSILCYKCEVCNVSVNSIQQLQVHSQGIKHKNNVANLSQKQNKLPKKESLCCYPSYAGVAVAEFSYPASNIDLNSAYQLKQLEAPRKHTEKIASNKSTRFERFEPYSRKKMSREDNPEVSRKLSREDNPEVSRKHVQKICSNYSSSNNNNRFDIFSRERTFRPDNPVIATTGAADAQFSCSACNIKLNSAIQLMQHEASKKHADNVSGYVRPSNTNNQIEMRPSNTNNRIEIPNDAAVTQYSCSDCSLNLNSATQLKDHLASRKHAEKVSGNVSARDKNILTNKLYSRTRVSHLNSVVTSTVVASSCTTEENDQTYAFADLRKIPIEQHNLISGNESYDGVQSLRCDVCDVYTNSMVQLQQHYHSRKHAMKEGSSAFMDTSNSLPPQAYITKNFFNDANRPSAKYKKGSVGVNFGGSRKLNKSTVHKKPEQPILSRMLNNFNSKSDQYANRVNRFHIKK